VLGAQDQKGNTMSRNEEIQKIGKQLADFKQARKNFKRNGKISFQTGDVGDGVAFLTGITITGDKNKKPYLLALKECERQLNDRLKDLS